MTRRLPVKVPTLKELAEEAEEYFGQCTHARARMDFPCSGCANSAAAAPYPGHPSGEDACLICVRNPDLKECQETLLKWKLQRPPGQSTRWFEEFIGSPIDNYKTTDVVFLHVKTCDALGKRFAMLVNGIRSAAKNEG